MSLLCFLHLNRRKKSNAVNVTPNENYECILRYYVTDGGEHEAHFVPVGEDHPLEPGGCDCGAEPKEYPAGWYIQHKRDLFYVVVPDYLPEEL